MKRLLLPLLAALALPTAAAFAKKPITIKDHQSILCGEGDGQTEYVFNKNTGQIATYDLFTESFKPLFKKEKIDLFAPFDEYGYWKNTHEYSSTLKGNEITFTVVSTYPRSGLKEIVIESVNLKNLKSKWRFQSSDGTKYGQEGKCKWIDPTLG